MLGLDQQGNVDRSVWELQVVLKKLGAPIPVDAQGNPDKLFGPNTQRAWSLLASSFGLDPRFERVSASVASVNKDTYGTLVNAYWMKKAPKPAGSTDFERLNNAIVRMPGRMPKSKEAGQLANEWVDVAYNNAWRAVQDLKLNPAFRTFWERYAKVWSTGTYEEKSTMEPPATVKPGSALQTFFAQRDFWTPLLDAAYAKGLALVQAQKEKLKDLLKAVGEQIGEGAAEKFKSNTYGWMWGIALGGVGVWYLLKQSQAR